MTPFERDYFDLHGRRSEREPQFIRQEDVRAGRLVTRIDKPGLRLIFGAVGLFWAIVLSVTLLGMIAVIVAFVAALLGF